MLQTIRATVSRISTVRQKQQRATCLLQQKPRQQSTTGGHDDQQLNSQENVTPQQATIVRPQINEHDLEENFISGSGPGGQKVNKALNCCQLRHIPTGIVVKVHQTRSLEQNRKIARQLLAQRLDNIQNGELSLENQKRQKVLTRQAVRDSQNEKKRAMKEQFKRTLAMSNRGATGADE